ncbi:hypothetical protein BJ170DRAFT_93100 [Xylariales sp. AK1849]|nr:hypothetical protein BJ170DRAFT_93100 [Xylariales sp. AK1849]
MTTRPQVMGGKYVHRDSGNGSAYKKVDQTSRLACRSLAISAKFDTRPRYCRKFRYTIRESNAIVSSSMCPSYGASSSCSSTPDMCKYVTHTRACFICGHEDTVLISEEECSRAMRSGVFGSCGRGIGTMTKRTPRQCWKCKDHVEGASRTRVMQQVGFH